MLYVSCPLPLNLSFPFYRMRLLACHSRQKMTSLSPQLALDYFPFPSFQSSSPHIAFSLISYSHRPLILLETSPVDRDPQSILHLLTLLMVYKNTPPPPHPLFLFKWQAVERAGVRINAQISTISPQLHTCQTPRRGERLLRAQTPGVFPLFRPAKAVGCTVKIDHYTLVGGRNLSAPPLAYKSLASTGMNQMVGT